MFGAIASLLWTRRQFHTKYSFEYVGRISNWCWNKKADSTCSSLHLGDEMEMRSLAYALSSCSREETGKIHSEECWGHINPTNTQILHSSSPFLTGSQWFNPSNANPFCFGDLKDSDYGMATLKTLISQNHDNLGLEILHPEQPSNNPFQYSLRGLGMHRLASIFGHLSTETSCWNAFRAVHA